MNLGDGCDLIESVGRWRVLFSLLNCPVVVGVGLAVLEYADGQPTAWGALLKNLSALRDTMVATSPDGGIGER